MVWLDIINNSETVCVCVATLVSLPDSNRRLAVMSWPEINTIIILIPLSQEAQRRTLIRDKLRLYKRAPHAKKTDTKVSIYKFRRVKK